MATEIIYDDGDPNLHICYTVNRQWAYEQLTAYKNGDEDAYKPLLDALRKYNRLKDYEDFINYAGEHDHPEIYLLAMNNYQFETIKPIHFAYKAMKKQQLSLSDFISFAYNKIDFLSNFFAMLIVILLFVVPGVIVYYFFSNIFYGVATNILILALMLFLVKYDLI